MKSSADVAARQETDRLIESAPKFRNKQGQHWPDRVFEDGWKAGIWCGACRKHWGSGSFRVGIESYIEVHKDMQ